ncbi:MAG: TolC family protein [Blastocatellia bacterium]|nr:TolC family protein [Blastocatellia bacterium]
MKDEKPRAAWLKTSSAIFKTAVATLFIAFLIVGYLSERTGQAGTLPQTKNPLRPIEKNIALGLDHFAAHCAKCHGEMGKADTEMGKTVGAKDLTSSDVQSKSDAEWFRIISRGVAGTAMPAFGKTHKPAEIWQTILFLRKLPTLTPEEKKKLEDAIPADARHKHGKKGTDHDHKHPYSEHDHDEAESPAKVEIYKEQGGKPQAMPTEQKHEAPQIEQQSAQPVQRQDSSPTQHASADGHANHRMPGNQARHSPSGPALTLAELERMALQNNPTLAQAESAIRAAEGRKKQAGLYPNPVMGYQGEELSTRAFSDKSEHFFFIEQTIPLGGKLKKSRRIFEHERVQAVSESEAQKQRVHNTVQMLYYEALAAQERVELRGQLAKIASEAASISEELFNIGQADRPDLLEAEVEAQQAELAFMNAENDREQVWQMLAAVVGDPALKPTPLAGNIEANIPAFDQATVLDKLLRESPEIKSARASVERARATVERAKAERTPDLILRGGFGYSTEELGNTGRKTGPEGFIEAGIRVPLFNRNQGGIAAAEAELSIAEREVQRLELALRARLSSVFRSYLNSYRAVERYQQTILPRAKRAYDLYLASFQQMAAAYPQVLIAQRTHSQVREGYVNALADLWQNAIRIQGYLLTGGLDAPNMPGSESRTGETPSGERGPLAERDH